jgi:hypothetical protein
VLLQQPRIGRFFGVVVFFPIPLVASQSIGAFADDVDRLVGPPSIERERGRRLCSMEQHQSPKAFVAFDIILIRAMPVDKIHERERVFGVLQGLVVSLEREPRHATMVVLHELSIRFATMLRRHRPARRFAARRFPPARGAIPQIV